MTLSDIRIKLENKLKLYPKDTSRGGDNYNNGMHDGLYIAVNLLKRINKRPVSLSRKLDYHNANPKYKNR